jgi:Fic family protein
MARKEPAWNPIYSLTSKMARDLMAIQAAREAVDRTPLPPTVVSSLRYQARLRSSHFSTRIEGNRLSLEEARQVIKGAKVAFHGRERDVAEVGNYWRALLLVEKWAGQRVEFSENLIRRVHGLVEKGPRAKPTPYRDGQNAIRDSGTGALVYLPPEAKDVPALMKNFAAWVRRALEEKIPVPLVAGLAHYQFVTIHPYYDGNGRTARLLATFLLHREGYSLNGFFSLEEHHARDLAGYYKALETHPHHNYYEGRLGADLTHWLEYFLKGLSLVFEQARKAAADASREGNRDLRAVPKDLDHQARTVWHLLADRESPTRTREIAQALGLTERMARLLAARWVKEGWLEMLDRSNKNRQYRLKP